MGTGDQAHNEGQGGKGDREKNVGTVAQDVQDHILASHSIVEHEYSTYSRALVALYSPVLRSKQQRHLSLHPIKYQLPSLLARVDKWFAITGQPLDRLCR
jgi:hypothetical protein